MSESNACSGTVCKKSKLSNKIEFVLTLTKLMCDVEADRLKEAKNEMASLNAIINELESLDEEA